MVKTQWERLTFGYMRSERRLKSGQTSTHANLWTRDLYEGRLAHWASTTQKGNPGVQFMEMTLRILVMNRS